MSIRAVCVHAHFYQPSREDPLLKHIPEEPGAAPYRNWNERILDHCYRPNAALGNFERISFDIGPTLANWLDGQDIHTMERIVAQDRANVNRFGVGNALAQPYHHTILPLSSLEDKITQVRWGIADFEHRFGRKPEGLWLPEAAVDEETLEVLVDNGIQYTLLAPWQAAQEYLDASQPYLVPLSNGRQIAAFFYDQELSMRVSFDPGATINADRFVHDYILPRYHRPGSAGSEDPQLITIASDGELYGHHQPFRDKFLEHLTQRALSSHLLQWSYPGLWLRQHPPRQAVRIRANTSWSCHHGVARWKESCGCTPFGEWKGHLRAALNALAFGLDGVYLRTLAPLFEDPWELRHQYIYTVLGLQDDRDLIQSLSKRSLTPAEEQTARLLLRAQYERQRMLTSCGWFFEDFDRIEPRNNVAYAVQAAWLTKCATGEDLLEALQDDLHGVRSWRSGLQGDRYMTSVMSRFFSAESAADCSRPLAEER